MNDLGISLVWLAGQVTLLCTVTAVIYLIARRRHPAAGATAALSGVLLAAVLTLGVFSPWPRWSFEGHGAARDDASLKPSLRESDVAAPSGPGESEPVLTASDADVLLPPDVAVESTSSAAWNAFWRSLGRELSEPSSQPVEKRLRWPGWLAVSLLLAMALGAVRLLAGWITVRRCLRRSALIDDHALRETVDVMRAELGCRRDVALRESDEVASAATVGWRTPVVLLPRDWNDWSDGERRAVLAHELAHVSAGDAASWLAAQFGLLLHFYHPLVHWLTHRLRLEQELAADALAARLTGSSQMYLTTLAELAVRQPDRRLAWPARAFLPTHGTLLRRIEMLRDTKTPPLRSSTFRRYSVITLTLAAALFAAGLRPPQSQQAVAQDRAKPQAAEDATGFNLENVPASTKLLAGIRPARIVELPEFRQLASLFEESLDPDETGLKLEAIDQYLVFAIEPLPEREKFLGVLPPKGEPMDGPVMEIRTTAPTDFSGFIRKLVGNVEEQSVEGVQMFVANTPRTGRVESAGQPPGSQAWMMSNPSSRAAYIRDERTLLFGRQYDLARVLKQKSQENGEPSWLQRFQPVANDAACFVWDVTPFRPLYQQEFERRPNPMLGMFVPLWQNTEMVIGGARFDDGMAVTVNGWASDKKSAAELEQCLRSLVPVGQTMLQGFKVTVERTPNDMQAALLPAIEFAESSLKNFEIQQADNRVTVSFEGDGSSLALMAAVTLPAAQQAREAARQTQTKNNLKRIGLAFHNYHDVHGHFPPPVLVGPDGTTKYSWRVALLPYFDHKTLYDQYDLNQPWDSKQNKRVLEQIPAVYRSPNDDPDSTNAAYFVLTGERTAVGNSPRQPVRLRSFSDTDAAADTITDNTAGTLLVVEAKRDIPWTKPEDIAYMHDKELPDLRGWLGGWHDSGFHACFADGRVRFISDSVDKSVFRFLITRDDGQDHRRVFQILGLE